MIWKDFFWFSRTERKGIIILSILLIGVALFRYTLRDKAEHNPYDPALFNEEYEAFVASLREKEQASFPASAPVVIRKVPFNPNTADSLTLLSVGLSPFATRNLLNYRRKGGQFRKPEEVSKIYGLDDELYTSLLPYLIFPEEMKPEEKIPLIMEIDITAKTAAYAKQDKFPEGTVIELNSADTTLLKMIPGIGSGIANRIVFNRNRLGGFYRIEQLEEFGLDTEQLRKWFTIDETLIKRTAINKAGVERLRNHPYLNFYQAKVIVEHRRKRGDLSGVDDLKLYEEFTPEQLQQLEYYFNFE